MLEAASVKSCLTNWRELVLLTSDLLTWEKDFYPGVTAAIVTLKFLFVWWWDPTLLSLLAVAGMHIALMDYVGPKVLNQIFKPENWTSEKEAKFDGVCENIVKASEGVKAGLAFVSEAKEKKPFLHFIGVLTSLFVIGWIGNRINNFFLAYLAILGLLMLPGLHKRGLLKQVFAQVTLKAGELMGKSKDQLKKAE